MNTILYGYEDVLERHYLQPAPSCWNLNTRAWSLKAWSLLLLDRRYYVQPPHRYEGSLCAIADLSWLQGHTSVDSAGTATKHLKSLVVQCHGRRHAAVIDFRTWLAVCATRLIFMYNYVSTSRSADFMGNPARSTTRIPLLMVLWSEQFGVPEWCWPRARSTIYFLPGTTRAAAILRRAHRPRAQPHCSVPRLWPQNWTHGQVPSPIQERTWLWSHLSCEFVDRYVNPNTLRYGMNLMDGWAPRCATQHIPSSPNMHRT